MAKVIRTVTTTAKGTLPYHFTCNYCGRRNDKVADISSVAVGGHSMGVEALRELRGKPDTYREQIRAYEERLRAGDNLVGGKYRALEYYDQSIVLLGLDGKCAHCGKTQAWAIDPSEWHESWRSGCLTMAALDLGGLVLFLIGAIAVHDSTWSAVLMILGVLVAVGGVVGGLIAHRVRNHRARKARLAEIDAAPNDPDKLPVIDEPEPDPWAMGT